MAFENIPYQSFCWVLGTTSFRPAALNLRIEEQLLLLSDFTAEHTRAGSPWQWERNPELQAQFYDHMRHRGALTGRASRKDKDARQKTSGLITLGLTNTNREITEAGRELTRRAEEGAFEADNLLDIAADSFIYLKQLLKASIPLSENRIVRPYYVLAYLLTRFEWLSTDEFTTLMPLVADEESLQIVTDGILALREGARTVDEVVLSALMAKSSYQRARHLLLTNVPSEELITTIGMNRKSRTYDVVYYELFTALEHAFLSPRPAAAGLGPLNDAVRNLPGRAGRLWRELLFAGASHRTVKTKGYEALAEGSVFAEVTTLDGLKELFFRYLHLHKAHATLADYADLNRRYFGLTETVVFEDARVRFDVLPRAYFSLVSGALRGHMFTSNADLERAVDLAAISDGFEVTPPQLLARISEQLDVEFPSLTAATRYVRDARYARFEELLETRFTPDTLLELLDCFTERDDARIAELVTHDATPSTVFEYLLGIVWYTLSGRVGDVLEYMKLSLEPDLMPRSHAQGGGADIVYEYGQTTAHPAHALLIEATLADGTNARQLEMEPVSRHLGNRILDSGNASDYCVFIAPELDLNVVNDFRHRKTMGFYNPRTEEHAESLKIIPLTIPQIKKMLEMSREYGDLYERFEEAFRSVEMHPARWIEELGTLLGG